MREQLPGILRSFRERGADAEAVLGGANRRPELVMLPYEKYLDLLDELDNLSIQALYHERAADGKIGDLSPEDAARELGFDPGELFAAPPDDLRKTA